MAADYLERHWPSERRLRRSRSDRVIAGVCGGLADWLMWDVTLIRVGFVLAACLTSVVPVVLLYFLLALIVPESPRRARARWFDDPDRY